MQAVALIRGRVFGNCGALPVHYSLQIGASDANDSDLSYSIQMKRGEYEQGRMNFLANRRLQPLGHLSGVWFR